MLGTWTGSALARSARVLGGVAAIRFAEKNVEEDDGGQVSLGKGEKMGVHNRARPYARCERESRIDGDEEV